MGVDTRRKPPLPAPTESTTLQTSGDEVTGTDLATDVSRRTDHTSFSIPEDGSPVTITTGKKKDHKINDKNLSGQSSHPSQTSLLIEYFEGGKGPNLHSRPSVRVKVTPSSSRKTKDATKDHIQITEARGRKPSFTRRISLGPKGETHVTEHDRRSVSSVASVGEDSGISIGRRPPVEIEVMHRDQGSDLSGTSSSKEIRYNTQNMSDISSMPPDSILEGNAPAKGTHVERSRSRDRKGNNAAGMAAGVAAGLAAGTAAGMLKTPSRRRSRSLSRERFTQKIVEKLVNKPRNVSGSKHKHGSKSRSRSVSKEQVIETAQSPQRRSSRQHHPEDMQSVESSLLSHSQVSDKRRSGDQYSIRSGVSGKSSINNPKLLETVEDAIKRLILPELTALKNEQRSQQARAKLEEVGRRDSFASGSSVAREETSKRTSRHGDDRASRGKPKVVLNRDDEHVGTVLSGDSIKMKKGRRHESGQDSPSERSFGRGASEETVVRDDKKMARKRSKDGHRLRDGAVGAMLGGILTHEALKHHDSRSSTERRERRKKRSKSHSRSDSVAESTEDMFQKHEVHPMPMMSEMTNSDLTRESILSERTSTPTSERRRRDIREVSRGSPREIQSPISATPTRSPGGQTRGLGMSHGNGSRGDLSLHNTPDERSVGNHREFSFTKDAALAGVAGAGVLAARDALHHNGNEEEHRYEHGRGLSPIQSVASYQEEREHPNRESFLHTQSTGSLSSLGKEQKRNSGKSIRSISSSASIDQARLQRPQGINLESEKDILGQHKYLNSPRARENHPKDGDDEAWYDQQHEENDSYRDSLGNRGYRDSTIDIKHMTNYTDDSMDAPYLDKVTAAQQIRGVGANAEYIHTPEAVESAVASLHDPSVLGIQSSQSGRSRIGERSFLDSPSHEREDRYEGDRERGLGASEDGSPLKHQYESHYLDQESPQKAYHHGSVDDSPRQSVARSLDERDEHIPMTASGVPDANSPIPEIGRFRDSKSDISTNPSIIRGPLGGVPHEASWSYNKTPPQSRADLVARDDNGGTHDSLKAAAANMLAAAAGAGVGAGAGDGAALTQRERRANEGFENDTRDLADQPLATAHAYHQEAVNNTGPLHDSYLDNQGVPTPLTAKDEGYISARSPGIHGPKGGKLFDDDGAGSLNEFMNGDDPFVAPGQGKYVDGSPHGLASPLYDSATGRGLDNIQSKDVVALMDHLTVRDSQRNARDTEILVTLVRSAAEMRNSFEDMKKFIADQDEMILDVADQQHARTVQKIGGPRPQILGTPRTPRKTSGDEDMMDDLPTKRRNVFKRALKGLGGRSTNDLAKIEDMLVHLLDEVADLKSGQDPRPNAAPRVNSYNSYENMRDVGQDGYEPEGQAGTSSTGDQSGFLSHSPSYQQNASRGYDNRRTSHNRVSTVLEGDEENGLPLEQHEQNVLDNQFENNELLTPVRETHRGSSAPLVTPPRINMPTGTQSNEHTPKTSTEKNRKHKSSSSSFFPKMSRWSKTTASSVPDTIRNSGRKERPLSGVSRSGSDFNYNINDHYDHHGDDRLRSNTSLEHERPPSPLVPSQVSEKPTYQAHRDSMNLQHPQPRPGPTARYQNHLESQAQNLGSPVSPSSDHFGSNPILSRFAPGGANTNRFSGGAGNLSPISDAGYSEGSAAHGNNAPPRPPKIKDDGPLIPSKIPLDDRKPTFAERSAPAQEEGMNRSTSGGYEQRHASPHSPSGGGLLRKPTGPRPITTSGNYSPDKLMDLKKSRYRGSPNRIESDEDVTF